METFDALARGGHEQIAFSVDAAAGYRGIVAIHSTALGPALGGTRVLPYETETAAVEDALRLSRGMSYKNAVAGIPFGGAKAIIAPDKPIVDREALFRAHGRFVHSFGGRFHTGEDVGTTPADMEIVRLETPYVKGLTTGNGDPSPWTARGVFRAVQAAAKRRWGTDSLEGRTVALQGCGSVGYHLAHELRRAGAKLIVADVDAARVERVARETGADVVEPGAVLSSPADVLAPCALGGILDDWSIPLLRAEVIAGAANNQLRDERHAEALASRGILYVPDFVANSGGVLSGAAELLGWTRTELETRIDGIYETLNDVFALADTDVCTPEEAAVRIAERRLRRLTFGGGAR